MINHYTLMGQSRATVRYAPLCRLLVDTWWYGLSARITDEMFEQLALQRVAEGFNAIQLVAGIPPEVGVLHPAAESPVGAAWDSKGVINDAYLDHAYRRIKLLNQLGLRVIVYGGWGQQIDWIGRERMQAWWQALIETVDELDVAYCLCGEWNLWVGEAHKLLPDRSTDDLQRTKLTNLLPRRIVGVARRLYERTVRQSRKEQYGRRRDDWVAVLESVRGQTNRPIIMHSWAKMASFDQFGPGMLDANTVQTGHSETTRPLLWQMPLQSRFDYPNYPFINLEPWYEGIRGQFYAADQLYAYWAGMLAGSASHCYGAHGIWNMGDGDFLAHWGDQTFEMARELETPRLLGASHDEFLPFTDLPNVSVNSAENKLFYIRRWSASHSVTFIPDVTDIGTTIALNREELDGRIWSPIAASYLSTFPEVGMVVLFQ